MERFVIEYELEKVVSKTTKNYLEEVISSYDNGNYRASIVVLYSVVLYDLLEKMRILADVYNDQDAKKVLAELKKKELSNVTYSESEKYLLSETQKRNLFNPIEMKKINNLREMRNWCAHPVYDRDYKLINPTREEVRSYIRITIEAVLSREILDDILHQANDFYTKVGIDGLKQYLYERFYSKMNQPVKNKIFDSLWSIVLKVIDEQCNKTRISSYYALLYLIDEFPKYYYDKVKNDIKYSNIPMIEHEINEEHYAISPGNSPLEAMIYLLCEHPELYNSIDASTKALVEGAIRKNTRYITIGYYTSDSMDKHLEKLVDMRNSFCNKGNWFDTSKWNTFYFSDLMLLYSAAEKNNEQSQVKKFIIKQYINAPSYDSADSMWGSINGVLNIFSDIELTEILDGMNNNNQINNAKSKSNTISKFAYYYEKERGLTITKANYKNLW